MAYKRGRADHALPGSGRHLEAKLCLLMNFELAGAFENSCRARQGLHMQYRPGEHVHPSTKNCEGFRHGLVLLSLGPFFILTGVRIAGMAAAVVAYVN
jgi:hypothetical protein